MQLESPAADMDVEEMFISLFSSLSNAETSSAHDNAPASVQLLEEKLGGPGVIGYLCKRLFVLSAVPPNTPNLGQEEALFMLSYLVQSRPADYMSPTASAIRHDVERFSTSDKEVSDALLTALAKLVVGPNSDDQVAITTDASAALLALCRWDRDHQNHSKTVAKRALSTLDTLWYQFLKQGKQTQRESSTSQMRIAALMVDICLLGEEEMSLSLSTGRDGSDDNSDSIMYKLLHIALDYPNDDPLLQVSALDQLERLTVHDDSQPLNLARADFLLANDILRRGLLCLVGRPGGLSKENEENDEWGEPDPINGGAAMRLLTEICRVGVAYSASVSAATRVKFQLLLSGFQKSLHNFHPQGELERLSFIYAVSSLVGSCAIVALSDVANRILSDTVLIHEWLSLHSRLSQPKLKSTVLSSLSQVLEPAMWKGENLGLNNTTNDTTRPSDNVAQQLYQAFGHANNERDSTELILASAKSPFVEERLGAYNMIRALVMRGACVRLLLLYDDGTGGNGSSFLEWLLNPDIESTIEGKKAKYQIVVSMLSANGDLLGGLIPARSLRHLEEWRNTGPHFITTVPWEMATE